jgi:hypothetical protein
VRLQLTMAVICMQVHFSCKLGIAASVSANPSSNTPLAGNGPQRSSTWSPIRAFGAPLTMWSWRKKQPNPRPTDRALPVFTADYASATRLQMVQNLDAIS